MIDSFIRTRDGEEDEKKKKEEATPGVEAGDYSKDKDLDLGKVGDDESASVPNQML